MNYHMYSRYKKSELICKYIYFLPSPSPLPPLFLPLSSPSSYSCDKKLADHEYSQEISAITSGEPSGGVKPIILVSLVVD